MSTQLLTRPTPDTTTTPNAATKPSLVLHHATMSARRLADTGAAADQLLRELRPARSVLSDAYVTHVRRIHRKRVHGSEASRTLSILEAALHRRPRDAAPTA